MANLTKEMAWEVVQTGAQFRAEVLDQPRFKVGQVVRALNMNPDSHTRLPRYIRGKAGTVEQVHGGFVFADSRGRAAGDDSQHLYSVRFSAVELWGASASPGDSVNITLWESYMEPVTTRERPQ
jgi:nitrile hydratase subunit beta